MTLERRAIKVHNKYIDQECLRIHGIDNDNLSSGSESGLSEFDYEYYKYQPQPICIDKKQIIIVENPEAKEMKYKWDYPVQPTGGRTIDVESGKTILPIIKKNQKPIKRNVVEVKQECTTLMKPTTEEKTLAQHLPSKKHLNNEMTSSRKKTKQSSTMISPTYKDHIKSEISNDTINFPTREYYLIHNFNNSHHNQILQPELIEGNINRNHPVRNILSVKKQTSNYSEIYYPNHSNTVEQKINSSDLSVTRRDNSINEQMKNISSNSNSIVGIEKSRHREVPRAVTKSSQKNYTTSACLPIIQHLDEIMYSQRQSLENGQVEIHAFPSALSNNLMESQTTNHMQNFSQSRIQQQRTYSDISNAAEGQIVISENIYNIHGTRSETNLTSDEISLMPNERSCFSCCNVC